MKELKIENLLKDWLTSGDMQGLDGVVKSLEELGEKAKGIKTVDDAYEFAKGLGMKCTKEEFKQGAEALEYVGGQIEKATEKARKQAEESYLDAVAVYMTAEKQLKIAQEEYAKYSKELEAEFNENRKLAPEYAEKAAKQMEEDIKKFYEEMKKVISSKDVQEYLNFSKNIERLGKRISKAKTTKDVYAIAEDLGLKCSWDDFKSTAKVLGVYEE